MPNLKVIKTYFHKHDAQIAKALLEDSGIESIVSADDAGGFRPHLTLGTGNVRLLVQETDFEKAKDVLEVLDQTVDEKELLKEFDKTPPDGSLTEEKRGPEDVRKIGKKIITSLSKIVIAGLIIYYAMHVYSKEEPRWKDSFVKGSHYVIEVESKEDRTIDKLNTEKIRKILDYRLELFGIKERHRIVKTVSERTIVVQLPYTQLSDDIIRILGVSASLEFRLVEDNPNLVKAALLGNIPKGYILKYIKKDNEPILLENRVALGGEIIADARAYFDAPVNNPQISLKFNPQAAKRFGTVTRDNLDRRLAIVLDGEVLAAPNIYEPILGGKAMITGQFDFKEAKLLALSLRAGDMPAQIRVIESRGLTEELWIGN
jgi:protein-export membrane protein SecD